MASTSSSDKQEHLYKILVIGELGTGKTSIIKRYVHQFFSQHYRATVSFDNSNLMFHSQPADLFYSCLQIYYFTVCLLSQFLIILPSLLHVTYYISLINNQIGVDFALKVINWDTNTLIRLQLWDIAGQERFGNMTRVYYKEAVGAFIVFDVTRSATFDAVQKWKTDLDHKVKLSDGNNLPCILLANKCDQNKEGVATNPSLLDEFCKDKGFLTWFETSAKENINIDEAARFLVAKILNHQSFLPMESQDEDKVFLNHNNSMNAARKKMCCSKS